MKVIINSPSLDPKVNVSGISTVTQFIISNNNDVNYIHFEVGRKDAESQNIISRIKRILRNIVDWKKTISDNDISIVHYNIPLMKGAIIRDYMLLKVAHKKKKNIVLHVHGGIYIKERNRPWYLRLLLNKIFSWSKHIIVLGDEEKTILEEDFALNNITSLPNCIDLSDAKNFNKDVSLKDCLDILYLGRIEPNKGIDYIFESLKKLKEKGIKFHLHFAGKEEKEGEYIPRFEETFGNDFTFHGVISGNKKIEILKMCDVFLMPSFYEGLPMSLLETMGFGQVPIVTPVGSIPNVVTDNVNGIFVNIKSVEDIVNAVNQLVSNRKLYSELSIKAKETIIDKFDDRKYIAILNKLYNN